MTDDVLELDGPGSSSEPGNRRGPAWTRSRTVVVVVALLVALALTLGLLLRPEPPPEPEVQGVVNGPVEAWRFEQSTAVTMAEVAGGRLLSAPNGQPGDTVSLTMQEAATGETLWSSELALPPDSGSLRLTDLPGTTWVAALLSGEGRLFDRETGQPQGSIPMRKAHVLSVESAEDQAVSVASNLGWIAADGEGTVFVGTPHHAVIQSPDTNAVFYEQGPVGVAAFRSDDLATPLWSVRVPGTDDVLRWMNSLQVQRLGGYAFFPTGDWTMTPLGATSIRTYDTALSLTDGSRPEWVGDWARIALFGEVAVVQDPDRKVRAIDPASGEELWATESGGWEVVPGEALYLWHPGKAILERRDPGTGRIRWTREMAEQKMLEGAYWRQWGADPLLRTGDDVSAELVRFDAQTGREVMRLPVDAPIYGAYSYIGEDQLVVTVANEVPHDDGSSSMLMNTAMGVDPRTGEIRWKETFDGWVSTLSRHLVVYTEDGDLVFHR